MTHTPHPSALQIVWPSGRLVLQNFILPLIIKSMSIAYMKGQAFRFLGQLGRGSPHTSGSLTFRQRRTLLQLSPCLFLSYRSSGYGGMGCHLAPGLSSYSSTRISELLTSHHGRVSPCLWAAQPVSRLHLYSPLHLPDLTSQACQFPNTINYDVMK